MLINHRRPVAPSEALLFALLLVAVISQSQAAECSLVKPLGLIESAFRTGKPEPLTSLMPQEGKVFLALDSLGGGVGYFSHDQVYFILGGIFNRNETINFSVKPQKPSNVNADRRRPDSGLTYCVGSWSYHRHDGARSENQIFFVLSMRKGVWSLVEIREAQ